MAAISVKNEIDKGIKAGLGWEDILVRLSRRGAISEKQKDGLKKYILAAAANALRKNAKKIAA